MLKDQLLNTKGLQFDNWIFVSEKFPGLFRKRSKARVALSWLALIRVYYHIHINLLMPLKQLLALTILPSSNQTLVVSEMNCLRDDWIPSRWPHFRKEVYIVVLLPCFLPSTFLYVHSCNMFSSVLSFELWKYANDSTMSDTILYRVKLAISRSLSTCLPRVLPSSVKFQYLMR